MTRTNQDAEASGPQRGGPRRYDGPMVRLHNPQLGVQVYVDEDKATRLLSDGTYRKGALPA